MKGNIAKIGAEGKKPGIEKIYERSQLGKL